jgi:dihydrodipicolinate synthase/N-acetylneuraminate lyase
VKVKGVHAAIVTHFDSELQVDHEGVAAQVERLITDGVQGIVACGTMGEANSLTATERVDLMRTAITAAGGRVPVCAGVSATSAALASDYARQAAAVGADSLMCQPPLLYRADRRETIEFFATVGSATELPMMVYNNPEATGVDMTPDLLLEITRQVPTVNAIKETSGDARRIAGLLELVDGDVDVLVGGDDWALEGCCLGAAGWISGVAVVLPRQCVELWALGASADLSEARRRYAELLPLARCDMTSKLVQYFKAALDEIGIDGGPCRPPRMPLTEGELALLRDAVAAALPAAI